MKILAFDTSTAACSVALLINGEIHERVDIVPQRHAELILSMIANLLQTAGITLKQLDAIAVGQGPGSFMGVRTAIGVAQGLAFGADLPVIPVSTLQALAQTAYEQRQHPNIIAAWDARMQAIYWGIYCLGHDQLMLPTQPDALNAPHEIAVPPEKNWLFAGNAWPIYRPDLTANQILDIYPSAQAIIHIAKVLYREGKMQSAMEIEPLYLRDRVAHVKPQGA